MNSRQKQNRPGSDLARYAGLGGQIFVSLGIAVFIGLKADKWLNMPIPLLVWILPLGLLVIMIYKLIRDTSKSKKKNSSE